MRIALKVDVDTLRGTLEGVPTLTRLFERRGIQASFLFSVGPDHTGRALRRLFKPGFLVKVLRTSVPSTYGLKTLAYGVLLPGPHIGRRAAEVMRAVCAAGFEVGLHSWDHVRWQDAVARKASFWTEREWRRGVGTYREVFGEEPYCFGAAGWQVNETVLELEAASGLRWASDTRGSEPFLPQIRSRVLGCIQLPTTLPTMDELIGRNGVDAGNISRHLVHRVEASPDPLHVFTLHAELEGGGLAGAFEQVIDGWVALGAELCSLGEVAGEIDLHQLPVATVTYGTVPGRAGRLAVQGPTIPDRAILDLPYKEHMA